MVKKLTTQAWKKIEQNKPAKRFIQSVEDGPVRIRFDSEICITEKGDIGLSGFRWEHDWTMAEAQVTIKGMPKLFSFGNVEYSFLDAFVECCTENGIQLEKLPGNVFDITKVEEFKYEIKYVGKDGEVDAQGVPQVEINEDVIRDVRDAFEDVKKNSPDIMANTTSKAELLKILAIRSRNQPSEIERVLPLLEKEGLIKLDGDKVSYP